MQDHTQITEINKIKTQMDYKSENTKIATRTKPKSQKSLNSQPKSIQNQKNHKNHNQHRPQITEINKITNRIVYNLQK